MASRNTKNQRPPFERWYSYLLFIFVGYCIADLAILAYRDRMLPQTAPPAHPKSQRMDMSVGRGAYNNITARNIFASNGQIPDALVDKSKGEQREEDPVPSQLPLTLIGTLVHSNPEKSIAAIEVKGKGQVISYSPKKEIEGIATIIRVERQKVVLRNTNSGRLEFIEMKKEGKVAFGSARPSSGTTGTEVQRSGDNTFSIKRADVLKYTNDLSAVLMQARAVPNREPGTGNINGFRILDMQPGSIYEQLGLQRMDVIKSVDGTPVDSPAKAMELYNLLKNSPKVTLQVERNGKQENMTYNIQ
ncbi:general secretion pathway protein GspC [Bdellovibrio bacteriovorus]|uniref:General secretion pathway protein GspC n=1 Tax=Bdellovibrio bacteriovorus TaxID=959 RepID=A0A150WLM9_BDEBC|nr:type II secretion system protein GspC [Bdellovibrio bacteriovorus]KYG64880.1 general secretion pathway protein GspC [Bdellovibrio bacteriovorus]